MSLCSIARTGGLPPIWRFLDPPVVGKNCLMAKWAGFFFETLVGSEVFVNQNWRILTKKIGGGKIGWFLEKRQKSGDFYEIKKIYSVTSLVNAPYNATYE